ncbi:MAG: hypothetical protein IGS03_11510 [Candidatus Sericytochromatia bacterium]|nr:hypothetical protein [Candidatus Sericytochromatia bacterium]
MQQTLPAYADLNGPQIWHQLLDLLPEADRASLSPAHLAQAEISAHPEGWQLQLQLPSRTVKLLLDPLTLRLRLL